MDLKEYLQGVNKTWKKDDKNSEILHCRLALIEEVGEIAGWYKKHYGYKKPKEGSIKNGLKEEFGDLLYYLVKLSDITECMTELNFKKPEGNITNLFNLLGSLSSSALFLFDKSEHSSDFFEHIEQMSMKLMHLIYYEGWELEDIMYSNLAKLSVRHGNGFKDSKALPENRDKQSENDVL